jgi:hypothetical protein
MVAWAVMALPWAAARNLSVSEGESGLGGT